DLILERSRNQNVAIKFECILPRGEIGRSRKVEERTGCLAVLHHPLDVKSFRVMNCTFVFRQGNDDCAALLTELSCVVADVSQSLYHDSFTLKPLFKAELHHVICVATNFTQAEKDAASGGFKSSPNSALRNGFTGHASKRIDLSRVERGIGVCYPGHLSLAGSVV